MEKRMKKNWFFIRIFLLIILIGQFAPTISHLIP